MNKNNSMLDVFIKRHNVLIFMRNYLFIPVIVLSTLLFVADLLIGLYGWAVFMALTVILNYFNLRTNIQIVALYKAAIEKLKKQSQSI